MAARTMNLSVLCMLVVCGCVLGGPAESNPAIGNAQPDAAGVDAPAPVEEEAPRDKRWYVRHPTTGQLGFALPVREGHGFPHPAGTPSYVSQTFPERPLLRTRNQPNPSSNFNFNTADPRYRSGNFQDNVPFHELANYLRYQQQQEQQFYQQEQYRSRKEFPDVVDTQSRTRNYFP